MIHRYLGRYETFWEWKVVSNIKLLFNFSTFFNVNDNEEFRILYLDINMNKQVYFVISTFVFTYQYDTYLIEQMSTTYNFESNPKFFKKGMIKDITNQFSNIKLVGILLK